MQMTKLVFLIAIIVTGNLAKADEAICTKYIVHNSRVETEVARVTLTKTGTDVFGHRLYLNIDGSLQMFFGNSPTYIVSGSRIDVWYGSPDGEDTQIACTQL